MILNFFIIFVNYTPLLYLSENQKSNEDEIEILESNSQMLNSPTTKKPQRRKRDRLYWEKVADGKVVHTGPFIFESSNSEDREDLQHQLPIEYFRRFFDNAILNLIVNQSNLYGVQKDSNKPLNLNQNELEQWLGLCLYFSIFKISSTKLHWSTCISQDKIWCTEVFGVQELSDQTDCMVFFSRLINYY